MTAVTVSTLLGDISQYVYNPALVQTTITSAVSQILDGTIDVVDATNPFVLALEMSAVNTAAFLNEAAALTRRQYPSAATTFSDLYLHMADTDYLNMFALPSTVNFTLTLKYDEVINALVTDVDTGISQITIPRNTVFYAANVPFSLQYPIHIRQLPHSGLQLVYDATTTSPLQTLSTNVIAMKLMQDTLGVKYIQFSVNVQQFFINSILNDVSSTSGLITQVSLTDSFYYCRVYAQTTTGLWSEIATTYTEQVYDPTTPTAVISVTDTTVTVEIPPVYTINRLIRGKLRIDVYETQGPKTMYMDSYQTSDFSAEWLYIDTNDATADVSAISTLRTVSVWSTDITTGGRAALTFEQMQARVISNSIGPRQIPITRAQAQDLVTDDGYTVVEDIDTLTNRAFWATKALPSPTDLTTTVSNNLYTPANANMLTLLLSLADGATAYGCTVHTSGVTITSAALFVTNSGIASLVTASAYATLASSPLLEQAATLNAGNYFYTPFYYVLDNSTDVFDVRPYSMDQPRIESRTFVKENATTALQVSIGNTFGLTKSSTGYTLTLTTSSNAAYQALTDNQVRCQLSFTTTTGATAFMLGTQQTRVGGVGERTFVFNLGTTYDLNSAHTLDQTSFTVNGSSTAPRSALLQTFNVFFTTNATLPTTYQTSTMDSMLGSFQLPSASVGITYEQLSLQFGYFLSTLWNNYRTFADTLVYQTYATDVPAVYTATVYAVDPSTNLSFTVSGTAPNQTLTWNTVLHHVGDPILDSSGQPTYLHRAGDAILDSETGLPVAATNYQTRLQHNVDVFALNAVYRFANDPITTAYMTYVYSSLLTWLTEDLATLNQEVLEQTEIYFYPSVSQGSVNVLIENDVPVVIQAAQSLEVTLYIPTETNNNSSLLASLTTSTIRTIGNYLSANTTVAVSVLEADLMAVYGSDVVDVEVTGFGGADNDYRVLTLQSSSTKLSIAKILSVQTNNQMTVTEDIKITYVVHNPN